MTQPPPKADTGFSRPSALSGSRAAPWSLRRRPPAGTAG